MPIGLIKFFNLKSGFGFIKDIESDEEYYFNKKSVTEEIKVDDKVSFDVKEVKRGKEATNINKIN